MNRQEEHGQRTFGLLFQHNRLAVIFLTLGAMYNKPTMEMQRRSMVSPDGLTLAITMFVTSTPKSNWLIGESNSSGHTDLVRGEPQPGSHKYTGRTTPNGHKAMKTIVGRDCRGDQETCTEKRSCPSGPSTLQ